MSMNWPEGVTSAAVREAYENAAEVFCEYCGTQVYRDLPPSDGARATGDHRVPKARGGADVRANIAICCNSCNKRKGMLTEAEFRAVMSDHAALRVLRDLVYQQERPEHRSKKDNWQAWEEVRQERQLARLMGRLVPADPDCELCLGKGEWRRRSKVHPCRCRVLDAEERREVERENRAHRQG